MGFRVLVLPKASDAFLLLAQLPWDGAQRQVYIPVYLSPLIPESQDSSLGVNELSACVSFHLSGTSSEFLICSF